MGLEGTWIKVQSYKHDGSLHRCWDRNFVISDNDNFVVVASEKTKVTEGDGRRWYTHEPAVTFFSKRAWFNVICMFKPEGIHFYCNIASPSLIDHGIIKYIDYDLDIKLFPDGSTRVLDRQEYDKHKMKYHYGDELDRVLQKTTFMLLDKMRQKNYPFQDQAAKAMFDAFKSALGR